MRSSSVNVVWNSIACLRSHIKAIEAAKNKQLPFAFICEDDIELVSGFETKFIQAVKELPEEWAMLYFNSGGMCNLYEHSEGLQRVKGLAGGFGYVVNESYYDVLLDTLRKEGKPCDGYYKDLQKSIPCFVTKEKLIKHIDGYSVRAEKNVVYPQLR